MKRVPPEVVAHFEMWREIEKETDRGAAVIAHAYLDNILREAIWSHFVNRGKTAKQLLDGDSGLGTFAAKAKLLYCLGYFGKKIYKDLITTAEIRNSIAHSKEKISFDSQQIKKKCDAFDYRYYGQEKIRDPRNNYLMAVSIVANIVKGEAQRDDRIYRPPAPRFPD